MESKLRIGSKIESIRSLQNLSREDLSSKSGISTELIEQLEHNENIPSLAPLVKIAHALGVRLGTFLDDHIELGPVVTTQQDIKQPSFQFSGYHSGNQNHLDFYSLAEKKAGRNMDPFIIDITPNLSSLQSLTSHEGEEFIFVLKGNVEITYGQNTYKLSVGDSIYYDSIVEHLVCSATNESAQILAVIYTPI